MPAYFLRGDLAFLWPPLLSGEQVRSTTPRGQGQSTEHISSALIRPLPQGAATRWSPVPPCPMARSAITAPSRELGKIPSGQTSAGPGPVADLLWPRGLAILASEDPVAIPRRQIE